MKSLANLFIISAFLLVSLGASAQKMLENRLVLHGGFGTGFYMVSTNQKNDKDNWALSGCSRLGLDFGLTRRLLVGVSLFRNGFATDKDSNTTVSNGNFGLNAQYLLYGKEYSGLYVTGGLGLTSLDYNNKNKKEEGKTNGVFLILGLRYQRFFGDHLGWFFEATSSGYQFKELEAKYYDGSKSSNDRWEMGITGGELKLGLIWAFGKKP